MSDIWLTSDTHFGHKNILTFEDKIGKPVRPFCSVEDMNETIIENWNSVVKAGDKVYHLGDVFFGPKEDFAKLWPRLNGSKRLVVGNHDDVKWLSAGGFFKKVMLWRIFKEHGLILSHVPMNQSCFRDSEINVHGHTHQQGSPEGPYKSVCVEMTNYKPVNIEELRV